MADDLAQLRDLFSHDTAEWQPIRSEGDEDMRYVAGDPWDAKDREAREKANRPCISADELSQYVNQVVNSIRANKLAVQFSAVGNGANDKTAQFYGDKMREIEYRSRAQIGYTTAFQNCVERSYGFVRVNRRYAHARSINQDLWIDPIPNPNLVTPDPEALMPDLSDQSHCWVREAWTTEDFDRKWPKFAVKRHQRDLIRQSGEWVTDSKVFVGEYWCITTKPRTLLVVDLGDGQDPVGLFEDDVKGAVPGTVLSQRKVDDPTVKMQLTNGIEVLEESDWPGQYIPIVGCFGKVLYLDESGSQKRQLLSMIRLAREPQMLYAYLVTCEAELIGATPKFPYFVYEGQLTPSELTNLTRSVSEPIPVVRVKATIDGLPPGAILPFPQRNPYEPPLAAIEAAKEAARRAIQAAMGQTPLPTAAQRRNEKSGVALKHIDELGQIGAYHFKDHYIDMVTQVGVIIEDLMHPIYDSARNVGIREANDKASIIRINDPAQPESVSTQGDHLVTVSTGPSFDSEREAASDFADTLIASPVMQLIGPQKGPQIIAQAIKLKNVGPIGDEMAKIIDPSLAQDGKADPQQAAQMAQQLKAENEQLKQGMQQAQQVIHGKVVEQQAKIEVEKIGASKDITLQHMKDATAIAVAQINASVKIGQQASEQQNEALATGIAQEHERAMAAAGAGHDELMAQIGHEQALKQSQLQHDQGLEAGDIAHQQGLEAGAQGHQQALEVNQQTADLAPAPQDGAGA